MPNDVTGGAPTDPADLPDVQALLSTDALLDAIGAGQAAEATADATADATAADVDGAGLLLAQLRGALDLDYLAAEASGAFSTVGLVLPHRRRLVRGSVIAAVGVAVALSATGVAAAVSANHSDALFPLHKLIFGTGDDSAREHAEQLLAGIRIDVNSAEARHGVSASELTSLTTRLAAVDRLVLSAEPSAGWRVIAAQSVDLHRRVSALATLGGPVQGGATTNPGVSPPPGAQGVGGPSTRPTSGEDGHGNPGPQATSSPDDHGGPGPSSHGGGPVPSQSSAPDDHGGGGGGGPKPGGGGSAFPSPAAGSGQDGHDHTGLSSGGGGDSLPGDFSTPAPSDSPGH